MGGREVAGLFSVGDGLVATIHPAGDAGFKVGHVGIAKLFDERVTKAGGAVPCAAIKHHRCSGIGCHRPNDISSKSIFSISILLILRNKLLLIK